MGFLDVYDQYLVNILCDPRVRPGMTKDELDELFPEGLPTVRAWVANAARMKQKLGWSLAMRARPEAPISTGDLLA
jgi:hypothetical protein